MADVSKVGKRGTVVIPAPLRRRFRIEEGSLVIAEGHELGILIRPAIALPADDYRQRLLDEAARAYAELREDPAAWAEELAEHRLLEGTLMDGLDPDEVWTEDDFIMTPSDVERE